MMFELKKILTYIGIFTLCAFGFHYVTNPPQPEFFIKPLTVCIFIYAIYINFKIMLHGLWITQSLIGASIYALACIMIACGITDENFIPGFVISWFIAFCMIAYKHGRSMLTI